MFTGIVEALGTVQQCTDVKGGRRLQVQVPPSFFPLEIGESIAINGCCLTLVDACKNLCFFDVISETLRLTNLGALQHGDFVNLEKSLSFSSRISGHLVQGHIDQQAFVDSIEVQKDGSLLLSFQASEDLLRYMIKKGSICVDGVSLTLTHVSSTHFCVALIPHTASVTTLGRKQLGDSVNIEVDLIAKYVEKLHLGDPLTRRIP